MSCSAWLRCVVASFVLAGTAAGQDARRASAGRIFVMVNQGVLAVDPETGESEPIGAHGRNWVRVAPDGQRVVLTSQDSFTLFDRRRPSQSTRLFEGAGAAVWSADGKQLLIAAIESSPRDGKEWRIVTWRINADRTDRTALALPPTEYVEDWSLDGQWVATTSMRHPREQGRHIYRMQLDGSDSRRLTTNGDNRGPRISPDGRSITYLHHEPGEKSLSVWIADADGCNARKVYQIDGTHPEVCWSPDGKRLALSIYPITETGALVREPGTCRIELIDPDGTNRVILPLPMTNFVGSPDWK